MKRGGAQTEKKRVEMLGVSEGRRRGKREREGSEGKEKKRGRHVRLAEWVGGLADLCLQVQ